MKLGVALTYLCLGIVSSSYAVPCKKTLDRFSRRITAIEKSDTLLSATSSSQMNFYSQASQDEFVYTILYDLLGKNDSGNYLEIGAGEPVDINNSYFFERNFEWNGVSIDISEGLSKRWYEARKNLLLTEDALQSDYASILSTFPKVIDYLSLDVDGYYDRVLQKIPLDNYIFKVITIEHDFYRYGDLYRKKERQILTSYGYHLLCSDVSNSGYAFEDWWIHPSAFPESVYASLTALDLKAKDHNELIKIIKTVTTQSSN